MMTERRILMAEVQADLAIGWVLKVLGVTVLVLAVAVVFLAVMRRVVDRHRYKKIMRHRQMMAMIGRE